MRFRLFFLSPCSLASAKAGLPFNGGWATFLRLTCWCDRVILNFFARRVAGGTGRSSPPKWCVARSHERQEQGERYRERIANVSEEVASHLESMEAAEILLRKSQVEKIDSASYFWIGYPVSASGAARFSLACYPGGRGFVQVNQKNE